MAQRPVVPKFGNWDTEDNVPYTVFFEKARKGKTGGKMINPNDPRENPDMFPASAQANSSRARTVHEEPIGRVAGRQTTHDSRSSREDSDQRKFTEAPLRDDNVNRRSVTGSTHQNRGGIGPGSGRTGRQSAGSEHSIDRSPLHPQYQAKMIGKGSVSPSWEGKYSNDSSHGTPGRSRMNPIAREVESYSNDSHGTPGRSRMKPAAREVESPDKGAAVPRFGDWDEKNPSSADNYTHIFNKVRQEKNSTSPVVSNMSIEQASADRRKQSDQDKYKSRSSCFPCFRK